MSIGSHWPMRIYDDSREIAGLRLKKKLVFAVVREASVSRHNWGPIIHLFSSPYYSPVSPPYELAPRAGKILSNSSLIWGHELVKYHGQLAHVIRWMNWK